MRTVAASELALWRAVEAQHHASTMVLVKTLDEQYLLEQILESSKPALPEACTRLHWLLFTPFRYPPLPSGSRFRAPDEPGVFYGAEERRTACAELGYWRWRFLLDSELSALDPLQQTLFRAEVAGATVDLREPPHNARRDDWTDPDNYRACQQFAREARTAGTAIIRYESVRDPERGACAAVLEPGAFARNTPSETQTWILTLSRQRVIWRRDSVFETDAFEFDASDWKHPSF